MLNWVLLVTAAFSGVAQSVVAGFYNKKKGSVFAFGLYSAIAVILFFICASGFALEFKADTFLWAFLFSLSYTSFTIGHVLAIKFGGVSLTSLVVSYSLIIPTVFGIIAYGEYPSWLFYIGLVLLVISLFFIGVPRKNSNFSINLPWVISVLFAFVGNGLCSLFQSHYQRLSGGLYRSEFMIIAMAMTIITCLLGMFFSRKSKTEASVLRSMACGGLNGIFNGTVNLLIMILVGMMTVSLIFPLYSAICLVATVFAGVIFFKEIPDKLSTIGLIVGVCSIVFLNL